jgi:2Fe-2S ferredoxin
MAKVTFVGHDLIESVVDGEVGQSIMRSAVGANVPGVVAECGGNMACGTCHVFVDDSWSTHLQAPEEEELEMLEFLDDRQTTSRLSCQVELTEDLDGLVVRTPEAQGGI